MAARQRQHRTVLVSQYDPARARADRDARASSAVNAVNVERRSDIADLTEKVGARGAELPTTLSADESSGGLGVKMSFERIIVCA